MAIAASKDWTVTLATDGAGKCSRKFFGTEIVCSCWHSITGQPQRIYAMTQSKKDATVAQLGKEVEALRGDLGDLVSTLKQLGVTESKAAISKSAEATDVLKDHLAEATQNVAGAAQDAAASAQSFVKDKPAAALLAAATAGLVIGMATSKRS
ncbi:hypothetical protein [Yoonia sp. BS5-3]|uniref:DUF883 domain-containing protein n=1 Tax=Yoonia phaeophyticola TaxID=3137369 RepID=A0ABZ2UYP5_9RHOB